MKTVWKTLEKEKPKDGQLCFISDWNKIDYEFFNADKWLFWTQEDIQGFWKWEFYKYDYFQPIYWTELVYPKLPNNK